MLSARVIAGLIAGLVAASAVPAAAAAPERERSSAQRGLRVDVLSNRADLISGGDALVAVRLPRRVDPASVRVRNDRRDVTSAFAMRPNGRFEGLVTGLDVGRNVLRATARGFRTARLVVTNHPTGGPVFSGPQVQPWACQQSARDGQCNQDPAYSFHYKRSSDGRFAPYDPSHPPRDVAMTTTDQGKRVPFIVRVETGYQNRDQYKIAVLYDPAEPWAPWAPQDGFNGKLLITHGVSCGIERRAGRAPDVMKETALARGFAVMSTALDNAGHNCNIATQAESLVMAKERLIEQYGPLRYTIGTGCSGGSLTQQQVANAYPGVYQGILPACSFPDAWSTGQQLAAYHLIRGYVEDPSRWAPGVTWDPVSIGLVEGHPNHVNSIVFDSIYWTDLAVPDDGCAGVPDEQVYHPERNPGGVRCTLADHMINVLGPRAPDEWGPQEKQLGRGFGGLPISGEGLQLGLEPLRKGLITPAQFVDLNAKVGGTDIDIRPIAQRNRADRDALRNAYLTGAINRGNHLDKVAIIDLRGPDPGAFHDAYRTWAVRARLEREQERFPRNHVIWFGAVPLVGDAGYESQGIIALDRWLAAVERDASAKPLAEKIADNRPADVQDRCSQFPGVREATAPGIGRVCEHEQAQTRYGTPATVAGESIATDTNACALKPLRRVDYYPIKFSDEQWRQLERTFPTGVCDFSRRGPFERDTVAWRTYQHGPGGPVIHGGRPLGPAPGGSGGGWTSPPFAVWRRGAYVPALGQDDGVDAVRRAARRTRTERRRGRSRGASTRRGAREPARR